MKKLLIVASLLVVLFLLLGISSLQATESVRIKLLNPPPKNKPLELDVGESYTFDILVTSTEPFAVALAMPDAYYPGRGVYWHARDRAAQSTSALLHLTMTGKDSTADLAAVCDWPEPGDCWPEGVAPVSIVVGARFSGGLVYTEAFPFAVKVP